MKTQQSNAFQHDLFETLPHKPYCTDELGVTYIRPKSTAIKKKYLQVNQPKLVTYLVFDIDRQGGVLSWYDNDLPAPYWTSKNPENGHAHIAYRLKVPFSTSDIAHSEPIRYAAAIQSAMTERLKADRGFAGLLTKNPLHPYWQNEYWTEYEYTLDELADYLDLKGHPLRGSETSGLGRNCELFDNTRQWAYRAIREYWAPNYKRKWNAAVYDKVESTNSQFNVPLPVSEVKAIAKSIANWTYREFTPEKFRQSQAKKGAKGGKASKRKPVANSERTLKPWEDLGISRRTYFRWKDSGKV
ncbi:replication initiation protein [Vibrio cholerae]|nr:MULTISPECIES: replication initiation protein [Vibrio]MBY8212335.1 replication initiation protein [Vibrio fluvialis]MBF8957920.1 replication initiation protein [Vibrio cholerae]MBF8961494.1 replication initiation protein [Vibrio cholerae]MBF8969259.1 replication initiation protein [Vibrio cholerae]MBF8974630.1 replication initiation protein [Vibrio cholerae]